MGFALIFGIGPSDPRLVAIFVTVLMTQLSISALNDWADRYRDTVTRRWRPIAMGYTSAELALSIAIVFGVASLISAVLLDARTAPLVLLGLAAGWIYDLGLKPTPYSFVPFAVAFPLLPTWVALIAGEPLRSLVPVFVAGALFAIAIHLGDSLPDIASDTAVGLRTLAVRLGRKRSLGAIVACLIAGLIVVLASLRSHPVIDLVLSAAGVIAVIGLLAVAGRRPDQARWIVSGFSLLAALTLMTHLPNV